MFFDFFKKNDTLPKLDFSSLKTDMHSHFIPGIDDGAQTMEQSIVLIKKMLDLGYTKIITTPHIMADYYRNTPEIILSGLDKVRAELQAQSIDIEIDAAAEYYLDETFENKLNSGNILSFSDKYLLFELSFVNPPSNIEYMIKKMNDKGYKPILAHPERYSYFKNGLDDYYRIKEYGCYFQLNTMSLIGYYDKNSQRTARDLITNNMIDFLGSDMHHTKHASALKETLSSKYVIEALQENYLMNDEL
ncbi:MAG: capsular biosynthesis protein [Sphingobacteriales bacterium]|nr:MAG: capsular biosynthesis protein [Sphingobacteriales bacterium]TAF80297.1 MAG: capsular biosynthesis protein [Sphingobacteriales bacterium]